jgi:hypothetical protein
MGRKSPSARRDRAAATKGAPRGLTRGTNPKERAHRRETARRYGIPLR